MSLTILVHRQFPKVGIVRWFLDPKVNISYPTGPLVQMPLSEFRTVGLNWVAQHFKEYQNIRLPEEMATDVFAQGEEKKFLKDYFAIRIRIEPSKDLTFIPQTFSKYTLAGLESMDKATRQTIPKDSSPELFWKTFDEILMIASADET